MWTAGKGCKNSEEKKTSTYFQEIMISQNKLFKRATDYSIINQPNCIYKPDKELKFQIDSSFFFSDIVLIDD
jgi:hypothetical protein